MVTDSVNNPMIQVDIETEEMMLTRIDSVLALLPDYPLEIARRTSKVWNICYRPCEPHSDLPTSSSWIAVILEFKDNVVQISGRKIDIDDVVAISDAVRTCVETYLFNFYNGNVDGPDTANL